jgi:hypothetical protein
MTMREALFAKLVAEEGYCFTDAYVEAFKPETTNTASLNTLASRISTRPRVRLEIDRLRRAAEEAEKEKENLPALLRSQAWLRDQIANGFYQIATSDADSKTRLKAWELLGRTKTADFIASGTNISTTTNTQVNNLGVPTSDDAAEMRSALVTSLTRLLEPAPDTLGTPTEVIDIEGVIVDNERGGM